MGKLLFVLLLATSSFSVAAENDYATSLTPLSVFDYNLNKFNDDSYDYCASCRSTRDKSFKGQSLAFLDDISVKRGKEPFRLDVYIHISDGVRFHKQDSKTKQYIGEIILEDIESRLRSRVSSEIKKEHLFGKLTWSSFSNAARKEFLGTATFEKGKVIDVQVETKDYSDSKVQMGTFTDNGIVDENGKLMEDMTNDFLKQIKK